MCANSKLAARPTHPTVPTSAPDSRQQPAITSNGRLTLNAPRRRLFSLLNNLVRVARGKRGQEKLENKQKKLCGITMKYVGIQRVQKVYRKKKNKI